MKRLLFLLLPLFLLTACAGTPTGAVSTEAASSASGSASVQADSTADGSDGTAAESGVPSGAASDAVSTLSLPDSSETPSSATSSKASSAVSSKASSAATLTSSQAVSSVFVMPGDTRVINGKTYTLTFKDDFSGSSLDASKWDYCPNWNRGNLNPPGRWDDSMVSVSDGCLRLGVSLDSNGVPISGAVRTLKKDYSKTLFSQCKGYFECRCQLQSVRGFWGAFWLMPRTGMDNNNNVNGGVDGAEIDIFESWSLTQNRVNHGIHWDGYGPNSGGSKEPPANPIPGLYQGFHTFGLEWTDTEYVFYIDGKVTHRTSEGGISTVPSYMKLTIECGTWAGTLEKSKLPAEILVDYVRVWQTKN